MCTELNEELKGSVFSSLELAPQSSVRQDVRGGGGGAGAQRKKGKPFRILPSRFRAHLRHDP